MAKKTTSKIGRDEWVNILIAAAEAFGNMPDGTVITFDRRDLKTLVNLKSSILAFHRDLQFSTPAINRLAAIIDRLQGERLQFIVSLGPGKTGGKSD